jgi:C-terminal processing protease CtpA/Prc
MNKLYRLPLALALLVPVAAVAGHKGDHKEEACTMQVQTCLDMMVTKLKTTGYIGVELDDEKAKTGAMVVTKVMPGTPAEKSGIQPGDELYAIDGVRFAKETHEAMSKIKVPGKEVTCTVKRKGVSHDLKMTLVPMPADVMAKYIGEHMMQHAKKEDATATATIKKN